MSQASGVPASAVEQAGWGSRAKTGSATALSPSDLGSVTRLRGDYILVPKVWSRSLQEQKGVFSEDLQLGSPWSIWGSSVTTESSERGRGLRDAASAEEGGRGLEPKDQGCMGHALLPRPDYRWPKGQSGP